MERSDLYQVPGNLPLQLLETLAFKSRQSANQSAFSQYTVTRVLRSKLSDEERLARGLMNVAVIRFRVPQQALDNATPIGNAPLPAPTPKPRDQFTDAGGVLWVVVDGGVESPLLGNSHSCVCQRAVV